MVARICPEVKDIERAWLDMKTTDLADPTFTDPEDIDRPIHNAAAGLNAERNRNPLGNPNFSAELPSAPLWPHLGA